MEVLRQEMSVATDPKSVTAAAPRKEVAGLTHALPRERALLRFCLTHHDRMFYDPDGSGISLPAWVSSELTDNELPLEDPEHARLLRLLSEGKHPDGIADERLSALILSLRASVPPDMEPVPDERLPDERLRLQAVLEDCFALSDRIAKELENQSIIPTGI